MRNDGRLAAILALLLPATVPAAQVPPAPPSPPRELRAVWVATVANIDWPSKPGLTIDEPQQEAIAILDRCQALRLNAVLLQVRPQHTLHAPDEKVDLEHGSLPDTIGETLAALIAHVESLEQRVNGKDIYGPALHAPEHGVWKAVDFSI